MVTKKRFSHLRVHERGVALVMAMAFLLVLTLIGVTTMSTTSLQEKMAGNAQDKHVAFQAAESALRVGENLVRTATPAETDFTLTGTNPGLFLPAGGGDLPAWELVNWAGCTVPGDGLCVPDDISGVKTQPTYIIEFLGPVQGTTRRSRSTVGGFEPPAAAAVQSNMYRITARGTGGTDNAVARVQSVYRR